MERDRVGIVLRAAAIEHRRQIGAAAEPGFCGDDEARVHVHGRHMRIVQMGDQRNAGGVKARIVGGAGNLLAEFRREFAEHGRDVDADLFEDAALHHRHDAAAAAARRCDRCGSTACARNGPAGGPQAARRRAARPRSPRTPRRCRRAASRTRRGRCLCAFDVVLVSMMLSMSEHATSQPSSCRECHNTSAIILICRRIARPHAA